MDAALQAILKDFVEESSELLEAAETLLSELEDEDSPTPSARFADVAHKIDSVMGTAKTLGLTNFGAMKPALEVISQLAEGCKLVGYKASQMSSPELRPIVAGFLADALEMIQHALNDLKKGYISFDASRAARIRERIVWISGKLKLSTAEQNALMKKFGMS